MAFYSFLKHDTREDTLVVYKATDPTSSWSAVSGSTYVFDGPILSYKVEQAGDDFHVAVTGGRKGNQDEFYFVKYLRFDPGTDAWDIDEEQVDDNDARTNFPSVDANKQSCAIAVRSDGDVVVMYASENDAGALHVADISYSRRVSGSWTRGVSVASDSGTHEIPGVIVLGVSDRIHFFWNDTGANDLHHRSLSSAYVLGTESTVDATIKTNIDFSPIGAVAFNDGTARLRVVYVNATADAASSARGLDVENPSWTDEGGISSGDGVLAQNRDSVACVALDGQVTWVLWADDVSFDIWLDSNDGIGGWGVDIEEQDAVTANAISCNTYDRSGQKLAYIWDSAGTTIYDERDIAGAGGQVDLTHLTDSLLKKRQDLTHLTDSLLKKQQELAHLTDSFLKKQEELEHLTDSLLKAEGQRTHLTDSLLKKQQELAHSTDSFLKFVIELAHSTDSLLKGEIDKIHTTDSLLKGEIDRIHLTDSLLKGEIDKTHLTDSLLKAEVDRTHLTDSLLKKQQELTHFTDSLKKKQQELAHSTDSLLAFIVELAHSTDSLLKGEIDKTHSTDSFLAEDFKELTHSTDSLLKKAIELTHSTDSFLRLLQDLVHSTDSLLVGNTGNVSGAFLEIPDIVRHGIITWTALEVPRIPTPTENLFNKIKDFNEDLLLEELDAIGLRPATEDLLFAGFDPDFGEPDRRVWTPSAEEKVSYGTLAQPGDIRISYPFTLTTEDIIAINAVLDAHNAGNTTSEQDSDDQDDDDLDVLRTYFDKPCTTLTTIEHDDAVCRLLRLMLRFHRGDII